jgi:endonuclease/exonuclease/phosphatase family metal-dependent hydrolase
VKIIQLNIWGGKLGQQIIDFLHDEQPDFVCMQEVNDLKGRAGYKFFATLDEIKDEAGFAHSFMSPTYSSRYMERELEYGNAILSQRPLAASETIFTRGKYMRHFDVTKDDGNIRNLQHATIQVGGKDLHILNHHGYHIHGSKAGDHESLEAMQHIARVIGTLGGPVILCGDFNLAPDSESLTIINEKLTNLSVKHGLKRTYNQFNSIDEVCDYIFVNDQVKVQRFKMSEALISDHKALLLEFEL